MGYNAGITGLINKKFEVDKGNDVVTIPEDHYVGVGNLKHFAYDDSDETPRVLTYRKVEAPKSPEGCTTLNPDLSEWDIKQQPTPKQRL